MKTRFIWGLIAIEILSTVSRDAGASGEPPANILDAFETASTFTLFSLDPDAQWKQVAKPHLNRKETEKFHTWPILGKVSSLSNEERKKLKETLSKGIRENQGEVAACFNPRHGIRLQSVKESIDLVICFQCDQVEVFMNGTKVSSLLTTSSPAAFFNSVLRTRKVPLPNGPK